MPRGLSRRLWCWLGLATCAFLLAGTATRAAERLPLVTAEWPPYTSSDPDSPGFVTEFVTAVVREMGMEPRIEFYPWSRAQAVIKSGQVFGGFPFGVTEERQRWFDFSDRIFSTRVLLFYHRNHLSETEVLGGIEGLKTRSVGVVRHSKTLRMLKTAGFTDIVELGSVDQCVSMLAANRIELTGLVEFSGWGTINRLFPNRREAFGTVEFYKIEAGLLVSRSYPGSVELRKRFNEALRIVRARGTYQRLLHEYGLPVQ